MGAATIFYFFGVFFWKYSCFGAAGEKFLGVLRQFWGIFFWNRKIGRTHFFRFWAFLFLESKTRMCTFFSILGIFFWNPAQWPEPPRTAQNRPEPPRTKPFSGLRAMPGSRHTTTPKWRLPPRRIRTSNCLFLDPKVAARPPKMT